MEAKNGQSKQANYYPVNKLQDSQVKLFVNKPGITSTNDYQINFKMDTSDLMVKSSFPQQIKIKAYTIDENNNQTIVSIINSSIFNLKQARRYQFT